MKYKKIHVVDCGAGNTFSICRALEEIGMDVKLSKVATDIEKAERLVLPGVASFSGCMQGIKGAGLENAISGFIQTGRPFLGICVGMQVLFSLGTEFGTHTGLNIIAGKVQQIFKNTLDTSPVLKLPFVGWAPIIASSNISEKLKVLIDTQWFYFLHSYMAIPENLENVGGYYCYGDNQVTALIVKENIVGLQFHPEKSGKKGLDLISGCLNV